MSEIRSIRLVCQTFQLSMNALVMLAPTAVIIFMLLGDDYGDLYRNDLAWLILQSILGVTALTVAFIAFHNYRKTGEPAMQYIVWGLLLVGTAVVLRLALTDPLFESLDPSRGPRLCLSILLLMALIHWRAPHHAQEEIHWWRSIVHPTSALMAVVVALPFLLGLNPWVSLSTFTTALSMTLAVLALIQAVRLDPFTRPMYYCFGAILVSSQASITFMMGKIWTMSWWLGQALFLVSILLLGHAVTLAYLTRQSLSGAQTEEEVLALMRQTAEAAQAARNANAAKTRFMAAASHDLRQPLVPIKLFAELLDAETQGTPPGKLVRKLRSSVQSLDELLNKMMEFSRLEAGAVHTRIEPVRLGDVLQRFHQDFAPVAAAKGLQLRWVDSSAVVLTDRVVLEQILRNLLQNALRYTDYGKVLIGCRPQGPMIRLEVYDTGMGIAADQVPKIFTDFYQANMPNRDRQLGLGLGLATVDRLAKVLGIEIGVDSVLGRGSCFRIQMPLSEQRRAQAPPPLPQDLPDLGPLRILLLDDESQVRESLVAALLRNNWEPLVATSIAEAIEVVESEGEPDAFITDLRLGPDECGLDAIEAVRQVVGHDLACLIITGDASHPRLAEAMASSWPILVKPFSMTDLYGTVTEEVLKLRASAIDSNT